MTPWEPGVQIGPYVLVALIGAGGMGEVWKARDTRLNRAVAIKRLKVEDSARFEQEARAIAALNHPNICTLHDIGPDYLVMEYVEGQPPRGPLAAEETVRLAIQIASALEEAHSRGILHRDLKPANVLVTPRGAAKLLDFGLATLTPDAADESVTQTVGISGTPAYMAPEQAEGKPLDARSDVFSFGAVLYELLSGRRAFNSLAELLRDDPPPLTSPLADIVTRCLAKLPAQRFQTMAELKGALERVSAKPTDQQPSIAVLPFADMSPDKDNEYFGDGLAEEIINALAQLPGLKVIARTSAFAFRGQHTDIRRIAEALGVTSILEGSVRKAGNRIRVTAQLITSVDGSHLWSQRYDREMADVFEVQDEIAAAIARALQVKLAAVPRRYTPNLAAYEAFLKGRHHWAKVTPESLARSRECLEQAVALDPQFALARNFLAEHFFALTANGLMPADEAIPHIRAGVLAALEIDPGLAESHALLGFVAAVCDYDWNEADRRFGLAMAREPVASHVRWLRGQYLLEIGRHREAAEEMERTLQEDPLHLLCRCHYAGCLHRMGRFAEALAQIRQVLDIDESYWVAHWYLAIFRALDGMFAEALVSAERAYPLMSWNTLSAGALAGILSRTGDMARADALLEQLGPGESYGAPVGWTVYHLVRLETDLAAEWIEKAIGQRDYRMTVLLPYLRSSSRWPKLAKLMNLPETVS